jgi:hypothetical protein
MQMACGFLAPLIGQTFSPLFRNVEILHIILNV